MPPSAITIPAISRHTATVIMAHGLGDSGAGWVSLAENWRRRQKFSEVKFIFPNAPAIPVSVNFGMSMPAWYDIVGRSSSATFTDLQAVQDEPGILRSQAYFHSLIRSEIEEHNIPSNRIVIGGFSQGGAMAIFSGVTYPQPLGGIYGLSCYLLMGNKLHDILGPNGGANQQTKIFMAHGDRDPMVKPDWAIKSADAVRAEGFDVEFKMYPGLEHSADVQEIDDLESYLNARLP